MLLEELWRLQGLLDLRQSAQVRLLCFKKKTVTGGSLNANISSWFNYKSILIWIHNLEATVVAWQAVDTVSIWEPPDIIQNSNSYLQWIFALWSSNTSKLFSFIMRLSAIHKCKDWVYKIVCICPNTEHGCELSVFVVRLSGNAFGTALTICKVTYCMFCVCLYMY